MERKHYCALLRILLLFLSLQFVFWGINTLTPLIGGWGCLLGILILFWMMYELFRLVKKDAIIRLWWVAPTIIVMIGACDMLTANYWLWSDNEWINGIARTSFLIYLAAHAWSIYSIGRLFLNAKYGLCLMTLVMMALGFILFALSNPWL